MMMDFINLGDKDPYLFVEAKNLTMLLNNM